MIVVMFKNSFQRRRLTSALLMLIGLMGFAVGSTSHAQIIFKFTDNGAGGTIVTGSGTANITAKPRGTNTGAGYITAVFPNSNMVASNPAFPVSPLWPRDPDIAFFLPVAGGTLTFETGGESYDNSRIAISQDLFVLFISSGNNRPPAGVAVVSGNNHYPDFPRTWWPIPDGTIDLFGDSQILFVFESPAGSDAALLARIKKLERQIKKARKKKNQKKLKRLKKKLARLKKQL